MHRWNEPIMGKTMNLDRLAALVNGRLEGNPEKQITGAAPFETAGPGDITFAVQAKYLKNIGETKAGAVLVPPETSVQGRDLVQVTHPHVAFARVLAHFHPRTSPAPGVHPMASLEDDIVLGTGVSIGACAVVQRGSRIGDRTVLHPGVFIGREVVIGADSEIFPASVVSDRCILGDRVIVQSGSVIGGDGFGYAHDGARYHKIPHRGIVEIDDDVEIGANNAIDRATFGKTWIQRGVKTDNLVHIAHNVTVGEDSVVVAQVGISGSVIIGRHAVLAGQAGISGHITLGDNVTVGPQSGIAQSIPDGQVMTGSPGIPHRQWLRVQTALPRLPEMRKRIAELERRIASLEKPSD